MSIRPPSVSTSFRWAGARVVLIIAKLKLTALSDYIRQTVFFGMSNR
jgi:hypothetical protein